MRRAASRTVACGGTEITFRVITSAAFMIVLRRSASFR
jgi:hypothetical protein